MAACGGRLALAVPFRPSRPWLVTYDGLQPAIAYRNRREVLQAAGAALTNVAVLPNLRTMMLPSGASPLYSSNPRPDLWIRTPRTFDPKT
jgi:hypothetical protein